MTSPSLTTVEQPIRQLGHHALAMLVRLIRAEPVEETYLTMATQLAV